MRRTMIKVATALLLGSVAYPMSAARADDVDMHKFWLDQQQSSGQGADPSTRVPDSGTATYQDDGQSNVAPTTRHLKHRRHQTNGS